MIILFGMAGSGKGTQGEALSKIFGWKWLSVGEVIRSTGAYKDIINNGRLIPDDDVIALMNAEIAKIKKTGKNIILDGYPRNEYQAKYIANNMANEIEGAIILEVPKAELYDRLALRGRDDDKERASIDRRFEVFEQNICSILSLLEGKNIPIERINGVGPINDVTNRLTNLVKKMCHVEPITNTEQNNK